jgi:hypothetical protein
MRCFVLACGVIILVPACGNVQETVGDGGMIDGSMIDAPTDTGGAMHTVSIALAGNGTGSVTSNPAGIACPGQCSTMVADGQQITITAAPQGTSLFLGWSGGSCSGTAPCTFAVTSNTTVNASFGLNFSLVVTKTGNGNGTVTSSPAGINCGTDCDEVYQSGSSVTLTAAPGGDSTFAGWTGGGCSGTASCVVTISTAVAVNASFTLKQQTLMASLAGNGGGSVASNPAGISCGNDCSEVYNFGTNVTLTATADATSTFTGWSGACTGTTCMVTMSADRSATATFTRNQFTLTVAKAGNGTGTVTSNPAGIDCGTDCMQPYNAGTSVTLTATPSAGGSFAGWQGGGCSGASTCTTTVNANVTITATFNPPAANIVFVTSTTSTANLGGIAGADSVCQARAQSAGLAGTYRAWLSTTTASAISRLGSASGWVRPDGKPVVNTTADLAAGKMFFPIRITESGGDALESSVHTATTSDGTLHPNSSTCNNYTAADNQQIEQGFSSGLASPFTAFGSATCGSTARLYCFGINNQASVTVTPPPAFRRAFITSASFIPGGGIAAADSLCSMEASSAGLPGTYKALLATGNASAASRFNTSLAPWARVDGVAITPTAATMFTATFWDSALTLLANGQPAGSGNFGVWGGASSVTAAGTAALTCSDWTSTAGSTGGGGRNGMTRVGAFFAFDTTNPCNATFIKLACLQQ